MADQEPARPSTTPHYDPRMRGFGARIGVDEFQARIDERVEPIGVESVDLAEAFGRVLREEVVAESDVPGFDRAAMDGYAVRGVETVGAGVENPASFVVIGDSRPGRAFEGSVIKPGEAVSIATGAPMPIGVDCVVMVESTRRTGDRVFIHQSISPGRHLGKQGEDIAIGSVVLHPGRVLRPQDLGLLSAIGRARVVVGRRPIVSILATGEELVSSGRRAEGYRIADMNSPMLAALVLKDGAIPRVVGPIGDDRGAIRSAILDALTTSDALLISGGSSTGPEDHAPTLVSELGEVIAHGVALRPAGPSGFGVIGRKPVVLLPGNPVSALCAYDFFAGRVVRRLGGRNPGWTYRRSESRLSEPLDSAIGRVDYTRVLIDDGRVVPIATSGASILSSTTRADGFVVIPADSVGYSAGDPVTVWHYD